MKLAIILAATAALTFAQANWPTYSGAYNGWRHSQLDQINKSNVDKLKVAWVYQMPVTERIETTPIVIDGIMYLSEPPSNVVALDAETGRPYWRYRRNLPEKINVCCGQVNRGVAVSGDRVFVGTVDAHLVTPEFSMSVVWFGFISLNRF